MVKYGTLIELKGCKPTPPCFPQIGFRENLQETPRIWALNPWFPLDLPSNLLKFGMISKTKDLHHLIHKFNVKQYHWNQNVNNFDIIQ